MKRKTAARTAVITLCLTLSAAGNAQERAFPGAEGFGQFTTGGKGGRIIHVTTLEDSVPGSLREAVEAKGKRVIVFDVSGTIALKHKLEIRNGDVSLLGETAPGGGVCVKNYETLCHASNVIIRYMHFRLGDEGDNIRRVDDDGDVKYYNDQDAAGGRYQSDIIVDHCSFSWSTDECSSWYCNDRFTMQWCILSESLASGHHWKGDHGYGAIWGGHGATFHHNLIVSHTSRNPRFCGSRFCDREQDELVDFRNNVIANWGPVNSGYAGEGGRYNIVNNYYKPGPATPEKLRHRIFQAWADNGENKQRRGVYGHFYLSGNYLGEPYWDWRGFDIDNRDNPDMTMETVRSDTIFPFAPVVTESAEEAYALVLERAGCSLRRDSVDRRIVNEVRTGVYPYGKGGIINSQREVGGWPDLDNP